MPAAHYVRDLLGEARRIDATETDTTVRAARIRALMRRNLGLEQFARYAVGPYWSTMSAAQRDRYLSILSRLIVAQSSASLTRRGLARFALLESRKIGPKDWLVASRLTDRQDRSQLVHWRLRGSATGYRFVDVMVDGTSLARSRRGEFTSVLRRSGGDIPSFLEQLARRGTPIQNRK